MEENLKIAATNSMFQDRHLAKKMKIKEAAIEGFLKNLLHEPHLLRSETT